MILGRRILLAYSFSTRYKGPYSTSFDVYTDPTLTNAEKDAEMFRRDAEAIRGDWNRVGADMRKAISKYNNGER